MDSDGAEEKYKETIDLINNYQGIWYILIMLYAKFIPMWIVLRCKCTQFVFLITAWKHTTSEIGDITNGLYSLGWHAVVLLDVFVRIVLSWD